MTTGAEEATTNPAFQGGSRPDPGAAAARLADLFSAHSRAVLGLCRALLRDPDEAEDAAQQTFLSAYRSLLDGTVPREPAAWLATIARNECRTRARSRMREPVSLSLNHAVDVHVQAVRSADVEALRRALAALPRRQRRAFFLREFSGLSYAELAAALGVSEASVEALLVRARKRLRTALAPARAAVLLPVWLVRELVSRIGDSSAPGAAKLATASLGVALITAGGATVISNHDEGFLAPKVPAARAAPPPKKAVHRRTGDEHPIAVRAVVEKSEESSTPAPSQPAHAEQEARAEPVESEPVETEPTRVAQQEQATQEQTTQQDDSASSAGEPSGDSGEGSGGDD